MNKCLDLFHLHPFTVPFEQKQPPGLSLETEPPEPMPGPYRTFARTAILLPCLGVPNRNKPFHAASGEPHHSVFGGKQDGSLPLPDSPLKVYWLAFVPICPTSRFK